MKKTLLMAALAAAVVGGALGGGKQAVSTFTDKRDGKVYRIVEIGGAVWMAENLNYAAEGSKCYGEGGIIERDGKTLTNAEIQAYCTKYGRLYYWDAAKKACPAGWHLATDEEWTALVDYAGGDSTAGTKLKSSQYWHRYYPDGRPINVPEITNDYGFSALPGGFGESDDFYMNADDIGYWWRAMKDKDNPAGAKIMNYLDMEVMGGEGGNDETHLLSVRCVADK